MYVIDFKSLVYVICSGVHGKVFQTNNYIHNSNEKIIILTFALLYAFLTDIARLQGK